MRGETWFLGKKTEKPVNKFVCYRRNILMDYGVQSTQQVIEADTVVEAAMVYWKKMGAWPDEIYNKETTTDAFNQLEALKHNTNYIREQRDRFANQIAHVEKEREEAYNEIEEIFQVVRQAIVAVNAKMKSAPSAVRAEDR